MKVRTLHLRVTDAEYEKIALDAEASGLTLSEYMRRRALGHVVVSSVDAAMIRELRRQGGLIKHSINEGSLHTEEAADAYRAVQAAIQAIAGRTK
jgi:uncharacterized protein YaaW (UPF0174 family)